MSFLEWNEHIKNYNEQKRLEEYQQQRKLIRPNTTKTKVALYILLLLLLSLGGVIFFLHCGLALAFKWLIIVIYIIVLIETYIRFLGIKMVECYQHYASDEKRRKCKCIPSCSEYAILCFKKYEFVYALLKIRKRLFVTCKGFDYIVDNP